MIAALKPTAIAREPGIAHEVVVAVQRALAEQGFERMIAGDPIVAGRIADALFDDAASHLRDDAVGLSIAHRIPIGGLGTIDYVMCTSATLGDALRRVTDHYGVATQRVRLELARDADRASLVAHRLAGVGHSRHWIEFPFALIALRIRQTVGSEVAFSRVSFAHPAPTNRAAHDRFFGVTVQFDSADERLVFDSAYLDRPLRTASRTLADLLEARVREATQLPPFLDRVRRTLSEMLDDRRTDIGELAERMNISKRTVQRELLVHGTSFSAVLDQIRRDRAFALLDEERLVTDVARRLGFNAPSAFFRAYRRWTGTSPKASRVARSSTPLAPK
jgi:AraC-like DNA-binding protein